MRKSTLCSAPLVALVFASGTAWAQVPPPPPPPPAEGWFEPADVPPPPASDLQPVPPGTPLPPNIKTAPDGSVSVSRTPEEGVDVHAQTSAGTVHAYGCNRVDVDPRSRSTAPPGPCPYPHAAPPYAPPYAQPYPQYASPMTPPPDFAKKRPKWAPDPARRNALIASSVTFGLGTMISGTAYVFTLMMSEFDTGGRREEPSKTALWAMGAIMTATPSIPRFVVGDVGKGVLYTALRGASFAAGTLIDWNDPTYLIPISLAFIAPLTLGIIDLATTPHREQLTARNARAANGEVQLQGIGPTVAADYRGNPVPALGVIGSF